jgi:DNA invertase Pin-like site-specific DNA recombinase
MIFGILAVMAEFEREMISERTVAGMTAAKRLGVRVGRPPKLTEYQRREAASMLNEGKARSDIAALLGVHVGTLRRALKAPDDLAGSQGWGPDFIPKLTGLWVSRLRCRRVMAAP